MALWILQPDAGGNCCDCTGRTEPCDSCTSPTGCECALLIPPFDPPYANYATAEAAIADYVADCVMYAISADNTQLDTYTVALTSTLDVDLASASSRGGSAYFSVSLLSGGTVSISASVTTDGTNPARPASVVASLYDCSGTLVDQDTITGTETTASGTLVVTAPADGEYILVLDGSGAGDAATFSYSSTSTFSGTFTINPVIALWDDSGTTRRLWACPKLLLPPLTEDTGDWYASCADADALLTDPISVSNCVGYSSGAGDNFTATDGGTSLTLYDDLNTVVDPRFTMWGGINLVGGQTVSVAYTISGGGGHEAGSAALYDDTGTLVQLVLSFGTSSGTLSFSAVPYTGRYTIRCGAGRNDGVSTGFFSANFVITSFGTLSVNPIQAVYDVGLGCAARLDCGDSCP